MNLVRDPRWGRNQEVYSECPRLSSALTVSFVRGVQRGSAPSPSLDGPVEKGAPSKYLQAGACCKHLVAYDVETNRMSYDAKVPARSFWEFYLPTFHSCLVEAEAMSSMCSCEAQPQPHCLPRLGSDRAWACGLADNSLNGVPTCGDPDLINGLLRERWGWDKGFVVSDYDAWAQIYTDHKYTKNMTGAAAVGINAGDIALQH